MKRFLIIALLFVGTQTLVVAQSTIVVAWDYTGVLPAVVNTYAQTLLVDNIAQTGKIVCGPRAEVATDTTCMMPIPMPSAGVHIVTIRASIGVTTAEAHLPNWNPVAGPKPGTNIRTTVTVIVTTGSAGN